ncbi:MAG: hypothetical protein JO027_16515 [Solirubrobacterales bacterium]|nr:hypothetical protein [Solirubrobacterales bacterium]
MSQAEVAGADQSVMEAQSLSVARARARLRAFRLVAFAVLLEVVLLMPFVDHLADSHPTIHFTQHGFIFGGGVLLGLAIRDVQRASRR